MPPKAAFIEAMAKHLPPSAAELRLLDVGGDTGDWLALRRADLAIMVASLDLRTWNFSPDSADAVTAYDTDLSAVLLAAVLTVMRPGGRLIIVNPAGVVDESAVRRLEHAGYTRILVEPAVAGQGVLIRGEKPHQTADTLARVQIAAGRDADALTLDNFKGRYVHLLVQQTPNKPVWRLSPGEKITWRAAAAGNPAALLVFSSLPKAVSFMQTAVMQGTIRDINKMAKFSKETARGWGSGVLVNPVPEILRQQPVSYLEIDPATAEVADE